MEIFSNIPQRELGAQGPTVSAIGLVGCMGLSDDAYGLADDTESISTLHQHWVDPVVSIEDVIGAMADLVRVGKPVPGAF